MPILKIGRHKLTVPEMPIRHGRTKPPREPRHSKSPWWGFSKHDIARTEPLASCPSARCCRARQCLAAIDGLYCLRTHHNRFEQQWLRKLHPLTRRFAEVPKVKDKRDHMALARRSEKIMEIRNAFEREMTERWKSGGLDTLYGKWSPKGALLNPPKREFEDTTKA